MGYKRVLKKIITPFEEYKPTNAILLINLVDPQLNTIKVFLQAIDGMGIPCLILGNKHDIRPLTEELKLRIEKYVYPRELIPVSLETGYNLDKVISYIDSCKPRERLAILGIFNSGKSTLINKVAGLNLKVSLIPGTTLHFTEHKYKDKILIDTVGQLIDINKPLMVSIDFTGCHTLQEKINRVFEEEMQGLRETFSSALPLKLREAIKATSKKLESGGKIFTIGSGASALVAEEIAGQGFEVGLPVYPITNISDANPVSFAKGALEEEAGLSRYIANLVTEKDIVIGVSASGGTGFVYRALELAKEKGALTISVTENVDSPMGHASDIILKSQSKPEGPSSSKIQTAHLVIGHAFILCLAEEHGLTADESIKFMLPEHIESKKVGIK